MDSRHETHGNPVKDRDTRSTTLVSIWAAAVVVVGLCFALGAVLKSASIPFLVVALAVFATVWVLASGRGAADRTDEREVEALRQKVKDLEERLANVEVINHYGERLAEKELTEAGEETGDAVEKEM